MVLDQKIQIPYPKIIAAATDSAGVIVMEKFTSFLEGEWIDTYYEMIQHDPSITKVEDQGFTYLFDHASTSSNTTDDRLVVGYGRSISNGQKRNSSRMQGFLGGGIDIPGKGKFDKGHLLAHSMGGGLDVNLFPQRPELNQGRSAAGRTYRQMERYASSEPGTLVFSRLIYCDTTWVPSSLEFGLLRKDGVIWVEWFEN